MASRSFRVSLGVGFVLGLALGGGVLSERISSGNWWVALLASSVGAVAVILASLVTALPLRLRFEYLASGEAPKQVYHLPCAPLLAAQGIGAVLGLAIVHLALSLGVVGAFPWLSEHPAQFVNDVVAVSTTLALLWAFVRRFNLYLVLGASALVLGYVATAQAWHLDQAPNGFRVTVQEFVFFQFVALALVLLLFRWVAPQRQTFYGRKR